tara:strand:- start:599 stop:1141 length:543 start_codon:yes stop_codon:yes gene_type:complete
MEKAWAVLKMPVVDTDVPGLRVAYQQNEHLVGHPEYGADQEVIDAYNYDPDPKGDWDRKRGMIGNAYGLDKYVRYDDGNKVDWNKTRNVASIEQMSPNEYFDYLAQQGYYTEPTMIDGKEYRWPDLGPAHIQSIIDGINSGQVIGAPVIGQGQEGGHRMEAIRQMGHGDTKIPVLNFHSN